MIVALGCFFLRAFMSARWAGSGPLLANGTVDSVVDEHNEIHFSGEVEYPIRYRVRQTGDIPCDFADTNSL